jgi:hypothetical protein
LKLPEYIFQHGDLAAHNIIMDTQTLEVKALVDWEYAGFYPPGMEGWPGTLCADAYNRRGNNKDHLIKQFLATEYLECYDKWSDKVELHELIKLGELPHPDQMRLAGTEDWSWGLVRVRCGLDVVYRKSGGLRLVGTAENRIKRDSKVEKEVPILKEERGGLVALESWVGSGNKNPWDMLMIWARSSRSLGNPTRSRR